MQRAVIVGVMEQPSVGARSTSRVPACPAACTRRQQQRRCRGPAMSVRAAAAEGVEAVTGVRPEVDAAIQAALHATLTETDLGMGRKYKVGGPAPAAQPSSRVNCRRACPSAVPTPAPASRRVR